MRRGTLTTAVVTLVTGASVLLGAAAAQAATIYPPSNACSVTPTTTAPGGTAHFSCAAGSFAADEAVTITVTGSDGADTRIGMAKLAITTASGTATSGDDGSLAAVPLTFSTDASGVYNVAAISASSAGGTSTVTITADGKAPAALPVTGADSARLLGFWLAGGGLILVGSAIAVTATVRRNRRFARTR